MTRRWTILLLYPFLKQGSRQCHYFQRRLPYQSESSGHRLLLLSSKDNTSTDSAGAATTKVRQSHATPLLPTLQQPDCGILQESTHKSKHGRAECDHMPIGPGRA